MNHYSLELLARDRIQTLHREAAGKRAPSRRREIRPIVSTLFARLRKLRPTPDLHDIPQVQPDRAG